MEDNRNARENYRLFASELIQEVEKQKAGMENLGITGVVLREKEANWESPLDIGRKFSAPVREFTDITYQGRTVTMDLQFAYKDYLQGVSIQEISDRFVQAIQATVEGDKANVEYISKSLEEDYER